MEVVTETPAVTFVVDNRPPWKQTPADESEKKRQAKRKKALQEKAKEVFKTSPLPFTPYAVLIRYSRKEGRPDSANIVGGILDGLQNIIFENDNQVKEIFYTEWQGDRDWYQVTVMKLVVCPK